MSITYIIDKARNLVTGTASGHITLQDIREYIDRLESDPGYVPGLNHLLDVSGIEGFKLTFDEVNVLSSRKYFRTMNRRALLTSSKLAYGISRVYTARKEMEEGSRVRVFKDRQKCMDYLLGRDSPSEDPDT